MRCSHGTLSLSALAASLALIACTSSGGGEPKQNTGAAGTSGGAGTAGGAGTTGGAGTGVAGTSGAAGATGAAGNGGSTGTAGTTGAGGNGGSTGTAGTGSGGGAGSSNTDGGTSVDGAPVTTAGCAGKNYALCMDFESPVDKTVWSGGNANAIESTEVAHGTGAYHLYSKAGMPAGGVFTTAKLGTLKDQIWGRAYIRFSPGAPGGHGNLIAASDGVASGGNYNGNWYEIGWQFQGIMGVFHTPGGERPLRSLPYLADKWYCLEFFIDGTATGGGTVNSDGSVKGSPRWWLDGTEVQYYTPNKGICCAATNPTTPASVLIPQFKSITVGWTPYAGYGLMLPDQTQMVDNRVLNDAWIDDVAFDTKRIGCIAP